MIQRDEHERLQSTKGYNSFIIEEKLEISGQNGARNGTPFEL